MSDPVTLAEAKQHLRIETTDTDDDALVTSLVTAATNWCQSFQGRKYVAQQVIEKYDSFPGTDGTIVLPYPPLISVTSIQYVDTAGDTQTLSSSLYTVDTTNEPGRIVPAYSEVWPTTRGHINDVTITYQAGYGSASSVPAPIKAAIKMMVAHLYENREQVVMGITAMEVPMGVRELLWSDRMNVV